MPVSMNNQAINEYNHKRYTMIGPLRRPAGLLTGNKNNNGEGNGRPLALLRTIKSRTATASSRAPHVDRRRRKRDPVEEGGEGRKESVSRPGSN